MRQSVFRLLPVLLASTLSLSTLLPAFAMTPPALEQYKRAVGLEQAHDYRGAEQAYRMAMGLDPYDAMTYLRLASVVEKDGRRDEALRLYEQALQLNPKDSMIHLSIAQIYETKNKPAEALGHYQTLLKERPEYQYALLPMARLEKALNQLPKAVADYETFLKAYPSHIDARRELAALQLGNQQYKQAAKNYKTLKTQQDDKFKDDLAYGIALNNADKSEEALKVFEKITTPSVTLYEQMAIAHEKLNHLEAAYASYQQAVGLAPDQRYDDYLKMADIAMTLKQPTNAITALQSYLKYNPANAKVTKSLADLYAENQDYVNASPMYEKALSLLPKAEQASQVDALRNLGFSYQMAGKLPQAIETYEKSLGFGDDRQTRLNLALAYHQQGDYKMALDMYRRLLTENPGSPTLRKDMGQVLMALGEQNAKAGDYTAATTHYQDALLLGDVQDTQALMGLANSQFALKNYPLAYTSYQRVLEKDPANLTARLNKAQLDILQKNYPAALDNLHQIALKSPENPEAPRLMAQTYDSLGDKNQAIFHYKKALALLPNDVPLLISYGNDLRETGDLDNAMQTYERARQLDPKNDQVRYNLASLYTIKNKLDASVTEYKAALDLNPKFVESYYGMGIAYEKQQKWPEALATYQQFVEKAPAASSYLPQAKARIDVLKKTLQKSAVPAKPVPSKGVPSKTATAKSSKL